MAFGPQLMRELHFAGLTIYIYLVDKLQKTHSGFMNLFLKPMRERLKYFQYLLVVVQCFYFLVNMYNEHYIYHSNETITARFLRVSPSSSCW